MLKYLFILTLKKKGLHIFFFFWLHPAACGIKPVPPALGAWIPNHWTAREVPDLHVFDAC